MNLANHQIISDVDFAGYTLTLKFKTKICFGDRKINLDDDNMCRINTLFYVRPSLCFARVAVHSVWVMD